MSSHSESPLKTGRANHFIDEIGMKAELTLTDHHLRFQTHHMNFRQYTLDMPLSTITSVQLKNNMRIFPYGILVTLKNGAEHRFAVWGRIRWVKTINAARKSADISSE